MESADVSTAVLSHDGFSMSHRNSSLPFARVCRLGAWFGFDGAALLPAVGTCVVLAFGAMPGRCCFLRVTHRNMSRVAASSQKPCTQPNQVSQHTCKTCIQGCARMHPVNTNPATRFLHSQSTTPAEGFEKETYRNLKPPVNGQLTGVSGDVSTARPSRNERKVLKGVDVVGSRRRNHQGLRGRGEVRHVISRVARGGSSVTAFGLPTQARRNKKFCDDYGCYTTNLRHVTTSMPDW